MEPGFKDMVTAKWGMYTVQGDSITKLKDKLKLLKRDLKAWNSEVFGLLDNEKKRVFEGNRLSG